MVDHERIVKAVTDILEAVGEDTSREGLLETPERVARMYEEVFSGLHDDPMRHLKIFNEDDKNGEVVIVRDIPLYSMCEHHLLPFIGKCHIAYIPSLSESRTDGGCRRHRSRTSLHDNARRKGCR